MKWEPWNFRKAGILAPFSRRVGEVFFLFFGAYGLISSGQRMGIVDYLLPFSRIFMNIAYYFGDPPHRDSIPAGFIAIVAVILGSVFLCVNLILSGIFTLVASPFVYFFYHRPRAKREAHNSAIISKMMFMKLRARAGQYDRIRHVEEGLLTQILPEGVRGRDLRIRQVEDVRLIVNGKEEKEDTKVITLSALTNLIYIEDVAWIKLSPENREGIQAVLALNLYDIGGAIDGQKAVEEIRAAFEVWDKVLVKPKKEVFIRGDLPVKKGQQASDIKQHYYGSELYDQNLDVEVFSFLESEPPKKRNGPKKKDDADQSSSDNKPGSHKG